MNEEKGMEDVLFIYRKDIMKRKLIFLFALLFLVISTGCGVGGESDAGDGEGGNTDASGSVSIQELIADLDAPQEVVSMFTTYMEAFEAGDCKAVAEAGYSSGGEQEEEIENCEARVKRYSHFDNHISTNISEEIADNEVVITFNRKYSESKEQQAVFYYINEGDGWKIDAVIWADFTT